MSLIRPTHRVDWRDWGWSAGVHVVLLAAVLWGVAQRPHSIRRPDSLDVRVQWQAEPEPPPVAPPEPAPAPPPPKPPERRVQKPPPRPQPAPMQPLPAPAISQLPQPAASAPDVVVPAVAEAPVSADVTAVATPVAPPPPDPGVLRAQAQARQAQWESLLEAALVERKQYPTVARRMRQEGVVTVEARFSAQGELLHCAVAVGSGFKALDAAALQLVQEAASHVRLVRQPGRLATLRIPIAYELTES